MKSLFNFPVPGTIISVEQPKKILEFSLPSIETIPGQIIKVSKVQPEKIPIYQ